MPQWSAAQSAPRESLDSASEKKFLHLAVLWTAMAALGACTDQGSSGALPPDDGVSDGAGGSAALLAPASAAIETAISPNHVVELQPAERQAGMILATSPNHTMLLQDTEQ